MTESIKIWIGKDVYPDPEVGDRYEDDELGKLTLVEVIPSGDGFDLTYETTSPSPVETKA